MIAVVVDGERFERWTSVSLYRSLDTAVTSFDLDYSDQWSEDGAQSVSVLGSSVAIYWDSELLLTGYVDQTRYGVSAGAVAGSTQGRALTGDLVDCSVIHATGHWRNRTASQILRDIVAPFAIAIEIDPEIADTDRIPRFDLLSGELAFGAIDRLCQLRGWNPTTTPSGALRISRRARNYGARAVTLDMSSVVSREYSASVGDLHSQYTAVSQTYAFDSGDDITRTTAEHATVFDPNVGRYRPIVLHSPVAAKSVSLERVADWLANQRVAASERVTLDVVGAIGPNGKTWAPGWSVYVRDPAMSLDGIYTVASSRLTVRSESVVTQLQLVWPESYSTDPRDSKTTRVVVKKSGGRSRSAYRI
jgi:prophage tail gpP-like protein